MRISLPLPFIYSLCKKSAQRFSILRLQTVVDVFRPPPYWLMKKIQKTKVGRRGLLVFFN